MNLTLDQLLALDAIARTGTFAGAARELHRVPSAITYLVRNLEDALGVALFDRTGRGVTLTDEGRALLERARDVLRATQALEHEARELAGGWEAMLHVIIDGALPFDPIASCLVAFGAADVPTRLRIDVAFQEGVIDAFDRSGADLALYLGFDTDAQAAGYDTEALPPLEVLLVAAADHPLASSATPAERDRYAELVVRDSARQYLDAPKPSFIGSRYVVHLADFHTKRLALLRGAGFGWVPRHFVRDDLERGALVVLDAEPHAWTYHPIIVSRPDDPGGRARAQFLELLRDATGELQEF